MFCFKSLLTGVSPASPETSQEATPSSGLPWAGTSLAHCSLGHSRDPLRAARGKTSPAAEGILPDFKQPFSDQLNVVLADEKVNYSLFSNSKYISESTQNIATFCSELNQNKAKPAGFALIPPKLSKPILSKCYPETQIRRLSQITTKKKFKKK